MAKSPIGNLLKTTFAPEFTIFSNFLLMIFHSASTNDWKSSGRLILNSEFSFSDFNSNSTFKIIILAFSNFFGCCSKPAYEKAFLNATPSTKKESVIEPPVTCLIPIKSLSMNPSSFSTAFTIISEKNSL